MIHHINRKEDGLYFAELIKKGDVSSQELIERSFSVIEEQNPLLNAVIHTRKEKALKEAGKKGWNGKPFGGVPILLKELGQNLKGEPATAGSRLFRNVTAQQTSHFVSQLLKAGFIPIGSTNVPEFGFTNITHSELYGPARNPFNAEFSAGGSSGGASAAVASGMVPIAGASDGGGSIRIPASFTGLIGLKPTRGRTPVGPGSGRNWQGAAISFALTKSIRDTAAMMDAMQIIQPAAAFQTPLFNEGYLNYIKQPLERPFTFSFSLDSPVHTKVSADAKCAVEKVVKWLEESGYKVSEAAPDTDGVELMRAYYTMNAGETAAMFSTIEKSMGRPVEETDVELLTWVLYLAGKKTSAADYSNAISQWDAAAEKADQFHKEVDLLIQPATAETAPSVDRVYWKDDFIAKMKQVESMSSKAQQDLIWDMWEESLSLTPFTQQSNLTGQPSISLPVHLSEEGLPIGVQITAPKGKEHWLLKIGELMERDGLFI
ncbi:MAG: amidase [Alkalibacterium sp.]|nr:amidase [Alkalibacterium sp.]